MSPQRVQTDIEAAEAAAAAKALDDWLGNTWGKCRDLAIKSGISRPMITKLRKGEIVQFSLDHAIAIEYGTGGELKAEQLLVAWRRELLKFAREGTQPKLRLAA